MGRILQKLQTCHEDELIERGCRSGLVKGSELDDRFDWMDKQYAVLKESVQEFVKSYTSLSIHIFFDGRGVVLIDKRIPS